MFNKRLLAWYSARKPDLPWRQLTDPYAVWVSEVMLQQTQLGTAWPFFLRWMDRFPTVESLAGAHNEEALAMWQGLGYYRRCRMLVDGAKRVVAEGWPATRAEWLRLPGIGPYTASAIASVVHGDVEPAIDGNISRVFARLALCERTGSGLVREAEVWGRKAIDKKSPGDWNHALMELGARVCTPRAPKCGECPVSKHCRARLEGKVGDFPVRAARPAVIELRQTIWVHRSGGYFGIRPVADGRWWKGMHEFPRTEGDGEGGQLLGSFRSVVTRHRIHFDVRLIDGAERSAELKWMSMEELAAVAMPAPQRRALKMAVEA